jgi:hypothetical protein
MDDLALAGFSLSGSHCQWVIVGFGSAGDVVAAAAVVCGLCGGRVVVGVVVKGEVDAAFA